MKKKWTNDETVALMRMYQEGYSDRAIAEDLGRTAKAVARKRATMGLTDGNTFAGESPKPEIVVEEDRSRAAYWQRRALDAEKAIEKQEQAKTAAEILCEIAHELAPKSYSDAPPVRPLDIRPGNTPQEAVLLLSDAHIGQIVEAEQTLGLGNYNYEIFLRRLAQLERSVASILQDHTTANVPRIHIAILGDMIHGNLAHSVECGQRNTLFDQFYSAGHALAQFLRNLSRLAPLSIYTAVGNHTRFTGFQPKVPTDNTYSSFDSFLYAYTQALVRDVSKITWHLDKQPAARFDVLGYRFLATHGSFIRGGDRALGIPAHAIGRNVSASAQLAARQGEPLPNYYLIGHLHRAFTLPHALGEYVINGAFPGIDGFALAESLNTSYPSQTFFLMHPRYGRTASYQLRLDLGDVVPHGYTLPEKFICL